MSDKPAKVHGDSSHQASSKHSVDHKPPVETENYSLDSVDNLEQQLQHAQSVGRVDQALILKLQRTLGNQAVMRMTRDGRLPQINKSMPTLHASKPNAGTQGSQMSPPTPSKPILKPALKDQPTTSGEERQTLEDGEDVLVQPRSPISVTPMDDPAVQREFYFLGVTQIIQDPYSLLRYLLEVPWKDKTIFSREKPRPVGAKAPKRKRNYATFDLNHVIGDFWRIANSRENFVQLSAWLSLYDPTLKAEDVVRGFYAYSQQRIMPTTSLASLEESEDEGSSGYQSESDEDFSQETSEVDLEAEKKEREDSWNYLMSLEAELEGINNPTAEGQSAPKERSAAQKRKAKDIWLDDEDGSDFKGEDEKESEDQELRIVVVTWNMEKLGKKSGYKEIKAQKIVEIVQNYHPTLMVMQEVTDAGLLFDGTYVGGKKKIPLGGGILNANLVHDVTLAHLDQGTEALGEKEAWGAPPAPNYPLSTEYGTHEGAAYEAGSYKESQPILFDTVSVRGTPEPYFVKRKKKSFELSKVPEGHKESFSSEDKITRSVLVWRVTLQTGKHMLRPEISRSEMGSPFDIENTALNEEEEKKPMEFLEFTKKHRESQIKTQDIYVLVVHTSPSIHIKNEVSEIMAKAQWLREGRGGEDETPLPIILAGDWYMEREDPNRFKQYVETFFNGEAPEPEAVEIEPKNKRRAKKARFEKPDPTSEPKWSLQAPMVSENDTIIQQGDRPTYDMPWGDAQTLRTNSPSKGVGQSADHYVITERFRSHGAEIIPPNVAKNSPLTTHKSNRSINEQEDVKGWAKQVSADHTPVVIYLTVELDPKLRAPVEETEESSVEIEIPRKQKKKKTKASTSSNVRRPGRGLNGKKKGKEKLPT